MAGLSVNKRPKRAPYREKRKSNYNRPAKQFLTTVSWDERLNWQKGVVWCVDADLRSARQWFSLMSFKDSTFVAEPKGRSNFFGRGNAYLRQITP